MTWQEGSRNNLQSERTRKKLTDREREILVLADAGQSPASIAEQLSITVRTVNYHLGGAYRKLGARSRQEALVTAREENLI